MKTHTLILIKGYAGAGKTTVSHRYAMDHDMACLSQDVFIFDFNPAANVRREVTPEDNQIGFRNMMAVMENYMKISKDIVLEGALVSTRAEDKFDLESIMRMARKYKYRVVPITLVAEERVRRKRQKERKCVLPLALDRKLARLADKDTVLLKSHVIDTTGGKIDKTLSEIHERVVCGEL